MFDITFYLMPCDVVSRAILVARAPSSGDVAAHPLVKVLLKNMNLLWDIAPNHSDNLSFPIVGTV